MARMSPTHPPNVEQTQKTSNGRTSRLQRRDTCSTGADEDAEKQIAINLIKANPVIQRKTRAWLTSFLLAVVNENGVLNKSPLEYYVLKSVMLHGNYVLGELDQLRLTFSVIRDIVENLVELVDHLKSAHPKVAVTLARCVRRLIICLVGYANHFRECGSVRNFNLLDVSRALLLKSKLIFDVTRPSDRGILPRMKDITQPTLLGSGGFGDVYKAVLIPANLAICVKIIPSDKFKRAESACTDKMVGAVINSPFLCYYIASFKTPNAFVTLLEYIPGVDLRRVLQRSHFINGEPLEFICAQMFLALEHLHFRGFIHRDIKIENTLCVASGRIKVIDYDTAKNCLSHFVRNRVLKFFFESTADELTAKERAGTLAYMAPEVLAKKPFGRASDMWSFGVCIYKLLTGVLPFRPTKRENLEEKIIQRRLRWPPILVERRMKCFVESLLVKKPENRLGSQPSYRQITDHPVFEKINFDQLPTMEFVCAIPGVQDAIGASSPFASGGAQKRVKLPIKDVQDADETSFIPLMTYCSPDFRKLKTSLQSKKSAKSTLPSSASLNGQIALQKDIDRLLSLGAVNLERFAVPSSIMRKFYRKLKLRWIKGVKGYLPQIVSLDENFSKCGLIRGDIVAAINDCSAYHLNKCTIKTAMLSNDLATCAFSVFQMSVWRQINGVLSNPPLFVDSIVEDVQIELRTCGFAKKFPFEFEIMRSKTSSFYFVINRILGSFMSSAVVGNLPEADIFVGDILWEINGIKLRELNNSSTHPTEREVLKLARRFATSRIITIGVLPLSPFRIAFRQRDLCSAELLKTTTPEKR